MKILIIDNYDSFTYNLVHYFEGFNAAVTVVFNDQIDMEAVNNYDMIVLSPGPGLPSEAGEMPQVIERYFDKKPILGVCLGFQAIYEYLGGKLYNQASVKHGVSMPCKVNNKTKLFRNLPHQINVGLYHSWAADTNCVPSNLTVTATSIENVIMAFEHKTLPVYGLQFHPESILTEFGKDIIKNFLGD